MLRSRKLQKIHILPDQNEITLPFTLYPGHFAHILQPIHTDPTTPGDRLPETAQQRLPPVPVDLLLATIFNLVPEKLNLGDHAPDATDALPARDAQVADPETPLAAGADREGGAVVDLHARPGGPEGLHLLRDEPGERFVREGGGDGDDGHQRRVCRRVGFGRGGGCADIRPAGEMREREELRVAAWGGDAGLDGEQRRRVEAESVVEVVRWEGCGGGEVFSRDMRCEYRADDWCVCGEREEEESVTGFSVSYEREGRGGRDPVTGVFAIMEESVFMVTWSLDLILEVEVYVVIRDREVWC